MAKAVEGWLEGERGADGKSNGEAVYEGWVLRFWSQDKRGGEKITECAKAGLLQTNQTKMLM